MRIKIIKGILMIFFACFVLTLPVYAELVAHWDLDENTETYAYDSVGSYTGTLYDTGNIITGTSGVFGTSYRFYRGGYVQTGSSYNVGTSDFSVGVWVRPGWFNENMYVFTNRAPTATQFTIYMHPEAYYDVRPVFSLYDGTSFDVTANMDVQDGTWHHIMGVREGTTLSLYVDGTLANTATGHLANINTSAPYNMGCNGIPGAYYDGFMDDIGVWSEALDAYEVSAIYEIGVEKFEALKGGIYSLELEYTTEELDLLAKLYDAQEGDLEVDGTTWTYLSGDLPGDIGGTTYEIGDSWIYEGRYYIKLGSGLEGGAVPEVPLFAGQGLLLAFGSVSVWVRKRRMG